MTGPTRIEGFAIISADGMLADSNRQIPAGLLVQADQDFFHGCLEHAALAVHGRHSHEGGPRADDRYRLLVTTMITALAPNPWHPKSLLWNPAGASLDQAWSELGAPPGLCAVIGGPDVYGHFLDIGYDAFHLTRAPQVRLPGGRPLFPEISCERSPEDVLADRGLTPGPRRMLDPATNVTLVTWRRGTTLPQESQYENRGAGMMNMSIRFADKLCRLIA